MQKIVSDLRRKASTAGRVEVRKALGSITTLMQIATPAESRRSYDPQQVIEFFNRASQAFNAGYKQEGLTPEEVGARVRIRLERLAANAQVDDITRALSISRRILERPDENGQPTRQVEEHIIYGHAAYELAKDY